MKKLLILLLCALLCMPMTALAEETIIVHATDMHYLSPAMTTYSDAFWEVITNADGKATHYTPEIMAAFVDEMLSLRPDAIVLTGDLTLNGAPASHQGLTALLAPLTEAGIPVLALPGNHDSGAAAYLFAEQIIPVDGTADEDIDDLYAALGYDDASSRDEISMSYASAVVPGVRLLLVDANANGTAGTVNAGTLDWLREQLTAARQAGEIVITASHQPVLIHNPLFTFSYVINNNTQLLRLYEEFAVPLNLSGHLHMQHVASSGTLTEIAGSSLAVSPHQYGVVRIADGRLADYTTRRLDVAAWAERTGQTNPDLLDFAAWSAGFFDGTTRRQLQAMLAEAQLPREEQAQMIDFAVRLNAEYFAGERTLTAEDPAWRLWLEKSPASFFTYYMQSILQDAPQSMTRLTFAP